MAAALAVKAHALTVYCKRVSSAHAASTRILLGGRVRGAAQRLASRRAERLVKEVARRDCGATEG